MTFRRDTILLNTAEFLYIKFNYNVKRQYKSQLNAVDFFTIPVEFL